ncbi:MAG: M28 family peptidase, partial [Flavobacteriales bacterium]|nr:M28 family peptidase [Flavobacteriales bacterium]
NYAYTVVYAAWDEEEYGLVGSNNYATAAENAGDTIVAVINIDAIAYDGDGDSLARVHVRDIANSLNLGTVAASMIGTYGIGLQIEVNNPGATYSDHASFWNHDFSAILIIEDFDNDGNPHYHTPTDEVQYFDNGYYHEIAKWAFATAATMAVPISGSVGVEENAEAEWRIYPNPTNGLLNISLDGNTATCNLEIVDMKGAAVLQTTVIGSRHSVDVSALPKGMYTLRMTSADGAVDISRPLIKN